MKKKYSEQSALSQLQIKKDFLLSKDFNKTILIDRTKEKNNDLGNGSWGKIDFLVKEKGYKIIFIKKRI